MASRNHWVIVNSDLPWVEWTATFVAMVLVALMVAVIGVSLSA
jgi:hypothetical protein